ncbi:MAG: 2-hydroxyacid dehydrogenase [Spirulina sp. SIO3F2]|nr:2-hydroxyacid dehydrogenase [Spirulina sp. SIO3F2]
MKVAIFNARGYDRQFLNAANTHSNHEFIYFETGLEAKTAPLAAGCGAVCVFVNDDLGAETLHKLSALGVKFVTLRCTGFNNVDLPVAAELGIQVARVTAYSPYSVAEHTVALMLMLNRKLYRAYNRVRDDNFALDGLMGFDLHGRTAGIIGTGKIGRIVAKILHGFGCRILGYDPYPHPDFESLGDTQYVGLPQLLAEADIVSLHCPMTPENHHLINPETIAQMKPGTMLINTSRGGLIDTPAVITGIKSGQIGYLGIDVYEDERGIFFQDLSDTVIQDDTFQLLQSFPNVIITGHQAFLTADAVSQICATTIANLDDFAAGRPCKNAIAAP